MNDLDLSMISENVALLIKKEFALKNCCLPIQEKNNKLLVAMSNTEDDSLINDLSFITKKEIIPLKCVKERLESVILVIYENSNMKEAIIELEQYRNKNRNLKKEIKEEEAEYAPTIKVTDLIINMAIDKKASDIHFEPFEDYVNVRYRIDGELYEIMKLSKENFSSICSRIKISSNMNIDKKREPQDGKIIIRRLKGNYDLRVSTMPTIYGEKIVMRILDRKRKHLSLEELGINNYDVIEKIIKNTNGIVLVTGPTGSGKSTTLYAMVNQLNKTNKNIVTIEDPVEYTIDGINQVNVNPKCGVTFSKGLRNILRQDPDIIMLGEIRDEETAEIAMRAAITGHLVFSTIHTNDGPSTILRLIDMGIPTYLIADSIIGIISQRLVRRICPNCKEEYEPSEHEKKVLNLKNNEKLSRGKGCEKCFKSGYLGRIAVNEIIKIDENHKTLISSKPDINKFRCYCKDSGVKSIYENCIELVKNHTTTFEEFTKICNYDEAL